MSTGSIKAVAGIRNPENFATLVSLAMYCYGKPGGCPGRNLMDMFNTKSDGVVYLKLFERYGLLLHLTGILIFLFSAFLLFPFPVIEALSVTLYQRMILSKVFVNATLILIFYVNLYKLTPRLLENKKLGQFVAISFLMLLLFLTIESSFFYIIFKNIRQEFPRDRLFPASRERSFPFLPQLVGGVISFFLVMLTGSIMVLTKERAFEKEARQKILYEKTAAELAVLKLQIGPHFLFNTLNNIRWLARQKSDKTEDAVVELAQLLRYIIQRNNEKVTLGKEIEYMTRFINLQRLRLQNHSLVDFSYSGLCDDVKIEHFLFIPFVENAFKYGIHSHKATAIKIRLHLFDEHIIFFCQNTLLEPPVPDHREKSGLGIANVQKRLALHYPDKHELDINQENGLFKVLLTIDLKHG